MIRLMHLFFNKVITAWGITLLAAGLSLTWNGNVFAAEKLAGSAHKSGPEIFVQTGHASSVKFLAMDKDERYLVSVEDALTDQYLKIWEISSGKELKTIKLSYSNKILNIYFTDRDKFAVLSEKSVEIYNMQGEKIEKVDLPVKVMSKTLITKNRKYFYTFSNDASNKVNFYDIKDGSEIKIPGVERSSRELISLGSGSGLISLGFGYFGVFQIYFNKVNGKTEEQFVLYDENLQIRSKGIFKDLDYILDGKIDPTAKYLYSNSTKISNKFIVYSLETGENICTINLREPLADKDYPDEHEFFSFSLLPDGRVIFDYSLSARPGNGENKKISVIKLLDNCLYKEKNYAVNGVTSVIFSNTSPGFLIHGHYNGNIRMLDLNTGAEIKSFGAKPVLFPYSYPIDDDKLLNMETEYSLSEKKSTLAFNLWNLKEGKLEKSESSSSGMHQEDELYNGHLVKKWVLTDPDAYYAKIPPNLLKENYRTDRYFNHISQGHFSLFKSMHRKYKVRKEGCGLVLSSVQADIAKLYAFADGEWIVITPEGYFNASVNGAKYLNVRIGNNVYGIDQFYSRFYRPELVQLALAGKEIPQGELITNIASQKPAPKVQIISPVRGSSVEKNSITVSLKITDNGGGIGAVNVYLNGAQVANETRSLIVKAKTPVSEKILTFTIPLIPGKNEIKAVAFNKENSMESNPALVSIVSNSVLQKPNLYALIIGINTYRNKSIALTYAVPDAIAFGATLQKSAAPLFEKMDVQVLTAPEATTKEAIVKAFAGLRLKIKPNDLFVFYDASHGIVDVVNDEEQYFLLTSNILLLSSRNIGRDALSQKELAGLVGNLPAQKKLIILDTCNAGKGGKEIQIALLQQTRGLNEATAVKLLQRTIGSAVFSASSDTQQALEGYKGHGLFTYVLMEGLQGKADLKKDGFITIYGLADYVGEQVVNLSEEVFKRQQTPTVQTSTDFPIGWIK